MCCWVKSVLPCFVVEYFALAMGCFELNCVLGETQGQGFAGRYFLSPCDERTLARHSSLLRPGSHHLRTFEYHKF